MLLASHDRALTLWTLSGGQVGRFGTHSWRLNDPTSFQDPQVEFISPLLVADFLPFCTLYLHLQARALGP